MDKFIVVGESPQIVYTMISKDNEYALLKGYTHRIIKRVLLGKIEKASEAIIKKEETIKDRYISINQNIRKKNVLYGTILHIDGDKEYLNSCIKFYETMNLHVWGIYIKEKEIENKILNILEEIKPDIVVITGHDSFNGKDKKTLENYENSKVYMNIVKKIRTRYSINDVIIIVGACSSCYEALIAAGANFASSPGRINIHTYDPAVVASKVASTSCNKIVDYDSIVKHIIDGRKAIGGIETKGKLKIIY